LLNKENIMENFICYKCNIEKQNSDFYKIFLKHKNFICKSYQKEYRLENYKKIKERDQSTLEDDKLCPKCNIIKKRKQFGTLGKKLYCNSCLYIQYKDKKIKRTKEYSRLKYRTIQWEKRVFNLIKPRSLKYNENIDFDEKYLLYLFNKQNQKCYYLNIPLSLDIGKLNSISIDRKNSKIGYIKNNIVICSVFANLGKNNKSYEEMKEFLSLLSI